MRTTRNEGRTMSPIVMTHRRAPADRSSMAWFTLSVLLATASLAAGCASFIPDVGFTAVQKTTTERLGKDFVASSTDADQDTIAARVQPLLSAPLSVDSAVRIALLNNRDLQASFQDLGISEADRVRAGRLPNPGFTFGRLTRGSEVEIECGLHPNLARLLAMPALGEIEDRRMRQVQAVVATRVLSLASETRLAWLNAVAAEQTGRYARKVMEGAEAGAELARRMAAAGNFNGLQQAREQGFYAEAALALARAEQWRQTSRERLNRLMGLWGEQTTFALPERLPDLPNAPYDLPDVERVAMAQRLDVQGARLSAEQTARQLGLTKTTRFSNVLDLGVVRNSSNEAPTQRGWEVSVELPIFDWGTARVARAEAVYMQSAHRAAQTAIDARSQVREAYGNYRLGMFCTTRPIGVQLA
jgi:outer membrane protein TolC